MRFTLLIGVFAVAALVGLFVFGQMLEPETRTIEVDVSDALQ